MKLTKINENQVRCIINREDIILRNTNLVELLQNKDKMHRLFKDMMAEVNKEFGDTFEETGIVMEAMITFDGSIVVTLTKSDKMEDSKFDPENFDEFDEDEEDEEEERAKAQESTEQHLQRSSDIVVYTFDKLDTLVNASRTLRNFAGKNSLYKDAKTNLYYLIIAKEEGVFRMKDIYFLNDFGKKESMSNIAMAYLVEHNPVLIQNNAVQTLALV